MPVVVTEYPKWIESNGERFVVHSAEEEAGYSTVKFEDMGKKALKEYIADNEINMPEDIKKSKDIRAFLIGIRDGDSG